jgi:hypothetical protein
LEVEKTEARRGEASRLVEGVICKECWSLNVPNVVKLFLWRALHDLLPTRVNLAKKGVLQDTLCPICAMEEETVMYIIWSCPASADVWGVGPRHLQKIGLESAFLICLKTSVGDVIFQNLNFLQSLQGESS